MCSINTNWNSDPDKTSTIPHCTSQIKIEVSLSKSVNIIISRHCIAIMHTFRSHYLDLSNLISIFSFRLLMHWLLIIVQESKFISRLFLCTYVL